MADSKITDLASGSPATAADVFLIARAGVNYKLTHSQLFSKAIDLGNAGFFTVTAATGNATAVTQPSGSDNNGFYLTPGAGSMAFAVFRRGSGVEVSLGDAGVAGQPVMTNSLGYCFANGSYGKDTGLAREAAGVVGITNGSTGNGQLCLEGVSGHRIASGIVTLTEAGGAETVAVVTTATTEMTGGELIYTIRATDATDRAVRTGSFRFAIQNGSGTVTANIATATDQSNDGSAIISTNAKTLTYAIAADVGTANKCKFTFNIDSDMTVSAATITWTMILNGPGTVSTT